MSQKATHLAFPCFKVIRLVPDWLLSLSSRCKLGCYTLTLTPSLFSLSLFFFFFQKTNSLHSDPARSFFHRKQGIFDHHILIFLSFLFIVFSIRMLHTSFYNSHLYILFKYCYVQRKWLELLGSHTLLDIHLFWII